MKISFTLNGSARDVELPPMMRLLDALRLELGLPGTKEGCGEGECGSCTVLLDGEAVNACLVVVGQLEGREVLTVEGLGDAAHLSPLQAAFVTDGGAQCGICTPGILVAAERLLREQPDPSEAEIREALAGNLCRCTGYQRIVESVRVAARERARLAGGAQASLGARSDSGGAS
jgi:carbon-monoxide dehydrogenase small subunit